MADTPCFAYLVRRGGHRGVREPPADATAEGGVGGSHDPHVSLGRGRGGAGGRGGHGKQEGEAQKAAHGEHGGWDGDDVSLCVLGNGFGGFCGLIALP